MSLIGPDKVMMSRCAAKKKIAHKDMRLAVELSNHELKKKK